MGCLSLRLILIIVLPILVLLLLLNVVTVSFSELGLSQTAAVFLLVATVVGSMINIPISSRQIEYEQPQPFLNRYFFYLPPKVATQVIAINLGGAIIPTGFALYLMPRAPLVPTLFTTLAVLIVARIVARPVSGMGIVMPAFISPLISAGMALLLARSHPAPVAYISGTLGTLIGADLLNWPSYKKLGAHIISIGGAGVFDGVFLSGILAVLISSI
jgi:uncharacterized membrane protein